MEPPEIRIGPCPAAGSCDEIDAALCPAFGKNSRDSFAADDSPVRCAIDSLIRSAGTHPAFCVPMQVGPKLQAAAHMLLPPGIDWTNEWRQLAQTYVNTAQSSLISLQLLLDAEQRSMTDALTGLYNRRSMEQLLQREVALAERYQHPLSLVMIDLDLFKEVNDTHGHAAGDHLLRSFADCVRITLRKTDLAFRYGGDEFVVGLAADADLTGAAGCWQTSPGVCRRRFLFRDRAPRAISRRSVLGSPSGAFNTTSSACSRCSPPPTRPSTKPSKTIETA